MENKFRAWCKDKKEWEKDSCLLCTNGNLLHYVHGDLMALKSENHIVQFYTGRKDKNDKEIFKGDIIEGGYLNPLTNKFNSKKYVVDFKDATFEGRLIGHSPFGDTWLYFIQGGIIGNIFENQELLKGDAI